MSICFYLGYASLSGDNYGSELAFIKLVKQLSKKVKIYLVSILPNQPTNLGFTVITPTEYASMNFDCVIVSRYVNFFIYLPIRAPKVYIWLHDVGLQPYFEGKALPNGGRFLLENSIFDGLVAQTEWHRTVFKGYYPDTDGRIEVIGNGIDTDKFRGSISPKVRGKFIWTSSPKRGLSYLLSIFPEIHQRWPEAQLFIYRGPEEFTAQQLETVKGMPDYVFYKGVLPNDVLAKEFMNSHIWLYPTDFAETYCISALEAEAAGCICICSSLAALTETVGDRGILLYSPFGSTEFKNEIFKALTSVFNGEKNHLSAKAREWGLQQDWSNRADRWLRHIGMSDLPEEKKEEKKEEKVPEATQHPAVIGLSSNWSCSLSSDWRKMVPPGYPYQIVDGKPIKGEHVIFNGTFGASPQPGDIHLTMEPIQNRGHVPQEWRHNGDIPRNMIEWHLNKSYQFLQSEEVPYQQPRVSMIISAERRLPGHHYRHAIADMIDVSDIPVDIYGRHGKAFNNNKGPLQFKDDGLFGYKYHIAIENCAEPGYFTEKLTDSILAECLTFYWGCPDIDKYMDPRAIVVLDPALSHEENLNVIRTAIREDWHSQRLPFIRIEKQRLLQWSIFPTLQRYLTSGPEVDIPTWVVNLDHRVDRWAAITKTLYGLTYRRKSAVYGKNLSLTDPHGVYGASGNIKDLFTEKKQRWMPYGGHRFIRGVIGCALSHLQLWSWLVQSSEPFMLVLEDDITLQPWFLEGYKKMYKVLTERKDWDLLYLGYTDDQPVYNDPKVEFGGLSVSRFNPSVPRRHGGGTFAYCISKKGATRLLQLAEEYGVAQPIDWFMIGMFNVIDAYKFTPHLITATVNQDTDIQRDQTVVS